jgi:hypothetical protein
LIVAVYRMTHDGWTAERAQEEANRFGMRRWQLGKKDYINDFYRDHLAQAEKLTARQSVCGHRGSPPTP